jgi:predicted transposase YbfD/YdcC
LHWILDVHLKEDDDQKSEHKSARSFALSKRIALNIVRTKDTTPKKSLRRKLKASAWDDNYLLSMLI